MMKKMTKAIFFGLLFLIAVLEFLSANYFFGIVLFFLNGFGMVIFEKREATRQFYSAIEKLYFCVDYDMFMTKVQFLERNALVPQVAKPTVQLLVAIGQYHSGKKEQANAVMRQLTLKGHLNFWKNAYEAMATQKNICVQNACVSIVAVPKRHLNIARQRLDVLKLTTEPKIDKDAISKLRAEVEAHILVAELSYTLAGLESDQRLVDYHLLVAKNLSKKCIL